MPALFVAAGIGTWDFTRIPCVPARCALRSSKCANRSSSRCSFTDTPRSASPRCTTLRRSWCPSSPSSSAGGCRRCGPGRCRVSGFRRPVHRDARPGGIAPPHDAGTRTAAGVAHDPAAGPLDRCHGTGRPRDREDVGLHVSVRSAAPALAERRSVAENWRPRPEVKGDFCGQIRSILSRAGRPDDHLEIGLDTSVGYNPLRNVLDPYAVAYAIATLLNNLFSSPRSRSGGRHMMFSEVIRSFWTTGRFSALVFRPPAGSYRYTDGSARQHARALRTARSTLVPRHPQDPPELRYAVGLRPSAPRRTRPGRTSASPSTAPPADC
jgi:hypothetical protein